MTTNENKSVESKKDEELKKVIAALYHQTTVALKSQFPEYNISGHIRYHQVLGPFFAYELKKENLSYNCGFSFNELIQKHKDADNAKQWLASFFIDMINEGVNTPLPIEPKNAEEANAITRDKVLPYCLAAIREEFGEAAVHVKFTNHPKNGPVLEAGFPNIKERHNVCAIPINLLLALYLLNRDCAELLINALLKIQEGADIA